MPRKTAYRWLKAAGTRPRRPGRPPYSQGEKCRARKALLKAMERLGWTAGWRTMQLYLPRIKTKLLQRMLSDLKLEYRRRKRRHRLAHRKSVIVLAKNAVLFQDSTHTGRFRGIPVSGEVVKDAATLKSGALGDGKPVTARQVLAQFKKRKAEGKKPLVWGTDCNPVYDAFPVRMYMAREKVIHLRSRPYLPQDNGAIERAIGEAKPIHGLGRGRKLAGLERGVELLKDAFAKTNRRPRQTRCGHSANKLARILPGWRARVARKVFYEASRAEIAKATKGLRGRKGRTAERIAIFKTLVRYGLAKIHKSKNAI